MVKNEIQKGAFPNGCDYWELAYIAPATSMLM